jgi:hypothetical protein
VLRSEIGDSRKDDDDERENGDRRERGFPALDAALATAHGAGGTIACAAERATVALVRRAAHLRVVVVPDAALVVEARMDLDGL